MHQPTHEPMGPGERGLGGAAGKVEDRQCSSSCTYGRASPDLRAAGPAEDTHTMQASARAPVSPGCGQSHAVRGVPPGWKEPERFTPGLAAFLAVPLQASVACPRRPPPGTSFRTEHEF